MSGQLLNRSRRCAAHRQVRTERVPQDVYAVLRQLRSTRRAQYAVLHHLPGQRLAVVLAQHVLLEVLLTRAITALRRRGLRAFGGGLRDAPTGHVFDGQDRTSTLRSPAARQVEHLSRVKAQHDADLTAGRGTVALPGSLRAKYPNAPREWAWQWLFPATRFYRDAETGERRRHHLHESSCSER